MIFMQKPYFSIKSPGISSACGYFGVLESQPLICGHTAYGKWDDSAALKKQYRNKLQLQHNTDKKRSLPQTARRRRHGVLHATKWTYTCQLFLLVARLACQPGSRSASDPSRSDARARLLHLMRAVKYKPNLNAYSHFSLLTSHVSQNIEFCFVFIVCHFHVSFTITKHFRGVSVRFSGIRRRTVYTPYPA